MSLDKSWFSASLSDTGAADITIFDEIGLYGVNAKDFAREFKALGQIDSINLHINSPGGEVFDGLAIHSMLRRSKAVVNVYIDGLAASIASVIAMAGDNIIMPENAMLMIHDPSGVVVGTSKEMRDLADAMDKIKSSMISAYGSQTHLTRNEIADLMSKETWLTAQEAVDLGFATQIEKPVQMAASVKTFNYSKFKHANKFTNSLAIPQADETADTPKMTETEMTIEKVTTSSETVEKTAVQEEKNAKPVVAQEATETKSIDAMEDKSEANDLSTMDLVAIATESERQRSKDILAVCQLSGVIDKAADFIASGKSLSDVVAQIKSEKVLDVPTINVRNSSGAAQSTTYSWDKALARINSKK